MGEYVLTTVMVRPRCRVATLSLLVVRGMIYKCEGQAAWGYDIVSLCGEFCRSKLCEDVLLVQVKVGQGRFGCP